MDTICVCRRRKMIGKRYSGNLKVRFDEGELEIEPSATTPAPYSTREYRRRAVMIETCPENWGNSTIHNYYR
jgi:hypothetical protein